MKHLALNTLIILVLIGLYLGGRHIYFLPEYDSGEVAPSFSGELKSGDPFSLESLRGDYVLIDFWGSWCPPCRAENPKLVELHQRFAGADFSDADDFHIVSIGVEKDADRWERAIRRDSLYWPYHLLDQASSLRFFNSPLAELYGVKEVPTKFLVNPEGKMVIVAGSLEEIENYLRSRL